MIDVKQDYNPSTKFGNYKTFAWMPDAELPDGYRPETVEGQELDALVKRVIDVEPSPAIVENNVRNVTKQILAHFPPKK